jgi:phenylacetate-CoA ligase
LASPRAIQNLLVSLKGLQLERQRRQGRYREFLSAIQARNRYSATQFAAYQATRAVALLTHAVETVPWYRELLGEGAAQHPIVSLSDLARFPLLSKDPIRSHPERFLSSAHRQEATVTLSTTGTTGSPMVVLSTHDARQENYAHFDNFFWLAGLDPAARRAILGGRILQRGEDARPPFWRYSRFQRAMLCSSYHMDDTTLPGYVEAMLRFQPRILEGYPSSLTRLALFVLARGEERFRLDGIVTSSETLLPSQREAIESAFGCRIFDQYGAAEMSVFAGQCAHGRYHVRPDYGVVELLVDGRPARPGEEGEVVCTGFLNPAMPLIRYRIGDRAVWDDAPCPCGLATPIFADILGRRDDVILTPEGREVGRLSPVLKGFPVREAQYVQEADGVLTVLIVPDDGLTEPLLAAIEIELRKRVGPTLPIMLRRVDSIPRGPGGKFRAVISRYSRSGPESPVATSPRPATN